MSNALRSAAVRAALLVALTIATYGPAMRAGFIWDDKPLITQNRLVRAGDGLRRFWFTTEAPDYYPLTWSVWWLEWRLWGRNPTGYHLLNVLLHAANATLVWRVLQRLKAPGAWMAALVFAVHPVNAATVAWISEQKNTLSLLFFLIALLLYLRFDAEGRRRWYGLSLGAFLLALLSKTAVVMLPVVLLGCVGWQRGRLRAADGWSSAPFFALALILGLVTVWFQSQRALEGEALRAEGFLARLAMAGWVPWFYLCKAVWPVDLMVIYPQWHVEADRWLSFLPGVAWLICFALFYWKRTSWGRPLWFGLGYFVVMLFPVMGFFDQGFYLYSPVADHWQYHAIIGVIALAVAAARQLLPVGWRPAAAVVVVGLLGAATWNRAGVYKDDEALWRDNIARNPAAWTYNNLANSLREAGRAKESLAYFERAVELAPDQALIRYNYAVALKLAGRDREEIAQYQEALRLRPRFADAHYNLGVALWESGDSEAAIGHWRQALAIRPAMADAHKSLGLVLSRLGRLDEACEHLERACRLAPEPRLYADAFNELGGRYWRNGRRGEAVASFERALALWPDHAEAHYNLGGALEQAGEVRRAVWHFQEALRLNPNLEAARERLARLQSAPR